MEKSKLYTKTGDKGTTSLVGGTRVNKSDLRLEAYGTIDELNAFLGLLLCNFPENEEYDLLYYIQNKLFTIGSYLATDLSQTKLKQASILSEDSVKKLEDHIDLLDHQLPAINNFVLPGGGELAAKAHVCRTVCRRAERAILRVNETHPLDDVILHFMNRLSDYLFVLSRYCNMLQEKNEIFWDKTCE